MELHTIPDPIVLNAEAIAELPSEPLDSLEGVTNRVLWRNETSMAGVLDVAGGCRLGSHSHRVNHHHMWVLAGQAVVLGRVISAGSYVHIPSGIEHDVDATASHGCTLFYLYLPPGDGPARQ